jgi:hypothetical protein
MDIGGILNGALYLALVGILGTMAGSWFGYYQAKKQRQYEYRKDLAAAIRTAYADFLKVAFAGGVLTEEGMKKYLTDLRAVHAPVSLLGSKDVVENIDKVLGAPKA